MPHTLSQKKTTPRLRPDEMRIGYGITIDTARNCLVRSRIRVYDTLVPPGDEINVQVERLRHWNVCVTARVARKLAHALLVAAERTERKLKMMRTRKLKIWS
jgi:hypothetical protein